MAVRRLHRNLQPDEVRRGSRRQPFTDISSAAASVVAGASGMAASRSTAAQPREVLGRPAAAAARAASHRRSIFDEQVERRPRLRDDRPQEAADPERRIAGLVGAQARPGR